MKKKIVLLVVVIASVFTLASCSYSNTPKETEPTVSPTVTAPIELNTDTEKIKQEALDVSYEELARFPDNYFKKNIKLKGQITQVADAGNGSIMYLLAVNDSPNQIAFVGYSGDFSNGRILKGDKVTFYGVSGGLISTDTANSGNVTCPSMMATTYE